MHERKKGNKKSMERRVSYNFSGPTFTVCTSVYKMFVSRLRRVRKMAKMVDDLQLFVGLTFALVKDIMTINANAVLLWNYKCNYSSSRCEFFASILSQPSKQNGTTS